MNLVSYLLLGIFLLACSEKAFGAKILYMSTTPSISHILWDKTIALALRQRGHTITFVSYGNEKAMENFTTITLEEIKPLRLVRQRESVVPQKNYFQYTVGKSTVLPDDILGANKCRGGKTLLYYQLPKYQVIQFKFLGIFEKLYKKVDYLTVLGTEPITTMLEFYEYIIYFCEETLNSEGIKELVKQVRNNVKYDLIIYDMTCGQCMYPFIEKFHSPPVVGTSPFGVPWYYSFSFGVDVAASYIPHTLLPNTNEMTFFGRVQNYFLTMLYLFWHYNVFMPAQWKLAQEFFGKNITHYENIEKNVSFLLANYDPHLDYPRPLPPAIIPVGGLTTRREEFLPQDLQEILDNAKDGVILFSLGTNIRSDLMSEDKLNIFRKIFSQLKQTVLWKFESDIGNLPKNVIVRPFLPQNDILAHPNLKLFITHGGGLSTQEAMYHKIPVVGIPFMGDQKVNMAKIVTKKLGLKLDYWTLTAKTALETINEVLHNPIYKKNMEAVSRRYRDQPEDALSKAVFWIEYTLRHGGGQHLRIAARDMPAYKVFYLDIWAFVIFLIVIFYLTIRKLYSLVLKYLVETKVKTN